MFKLESSFKPSGDQVAGLDISSCFLAKA